MYLNHAPRGPVGTRPYEDVIGRLLNIHEDGRGLVADFHYNPAHPAAEQVVYDAINAPGNLGFSIASNGRGDRRDNNGRQVVEEVVWDPRSHSFDLVSSPASTQGLYESRRPQQSPESPAHSLLEHRRDTSPAAAAHRTSIIRHLRHGC